MKLTSWKAKNLSLAGRITLAKSVIQSTPIYPMMSGEVPNACLKDIQKIQRGFVWGQYDDQRRVHLVNWNTVTLPKSLGGLGLRDLSIMNQACLLKMCWAIRVGENSLWSGVSLGKYGRNFHTDGRVVSKGSDSNLWRHMVHLWDGMKSMEYWSIGNGQSTHFWNDSWVEPGLRLIEFAAGIPSDIEEARVCDMVNDSGQWTCVKLGDSWPMDMKLKINAVLPLEAGNGLDKVLWAETADGIFTVKSSYEALYRFKFDLQDGIWKRIWRMGVPERIRTFIWLVKHERLLTNKRNSKMGLVRPYCGHCIMEVETIIHVLRDCPKAVEVWHHLVRREVRSLFFL